MSLLKIFFLLFLAFQIIQVDKINPKYDKKDEIKAPKEVMNIFKRSCWDCHSNDTVWPWYASVAPFSWTIVKNVRNGRAYVNFSIWETYTNKQKDKKLEEIYRTMNGAMPPAGYIRFHSDANITNEQKDLIQTWTGKAIF